MLSVIDSFVVMLQSDLAGTPPVHWVRVSADENSNRTQIGALNVSVLGFNQKGPAEEALVSLDLIGTDERTVWQWAKLVRDVLLAKQYTPELDYATTPSSPVANGQMVEWDGNTKVNFSVVVADTNYVHLNATFPITHART